MAQEDIGGGACSAPVFNSLSQIYLLFWSRDLTHCLKSEFFHQAGFLETISLLFIQDLFLLLGLTYSSDSHALSPTVWPWASKLFVVDFFLFCTLVPVLLSDTYYTWATDNALSFIWSTWGYITILKILATSLIVIMHLLYYEFNIFTSVLLLNKLNWLRKW